jgi:hypothetical protein
MVGSAMSKADFVVKKVTKAECANILLKHHYLKDISKNFKSGFNYGVFKNNNCVGVVIYTGFPVPELAKGMLGLERTDQEGLFELSRLCLTPEIQQKEHNLASWFVAKSLAMLQKETKVRIVLSYADVDFHSGTVYRASNFNYYGLTTVKKDFWVKQSDGSYIKHNRGKVKGIDGEWRKRSQKHRFVLVFDKQLKILWKKIPYEAT